MFFGYFLTSIYALICLNSVSGVNGAIGATKECYNGKNTSNGRQYRVPELPVETWQNIAELSGPSTVPWLLNGVCRRLRWSKIYYSTHQVEHMIEIQATEHATVSGLFLLDRIFAGNMLMMPRDVTLLPLDNRYMESIERSNLKFRKNIIYGGKINVSADLVPEKLIERSASLGCLNILTKFWSHPRMKARHIYNGFKYAVRNSRNDVVVMLSKHPLLGNGAFHDAFLTACQTCNQFLIEFLVGKVTIYAINGGLHGVATSGCSKEILVFLLDRLSTLVQEASNEANGIEFQALAKSIVNSIIRYAAETDNLDYFIALYQHPWLDERGLTDAFAFSAIRCNIPMIEMLLYDDRLGKRLVSKAFREYDGRLFLNCFLELIEAGHEGILFTKVSRGHRIIRKFLPAISSILKINEA